MPEQKPYRLPITVIPERYEIKLAPEFSAATFAGEEKFLFKLSSPSGKSLSTRPSWNSSRFDQRARRQGGAGECGFGHRERAGDLRLP